jgi:hypothetical protein
MLQASQQYLHALHDSRIVWVGNRPITPQFFSNSLRNVVASTNATIARPVSHALGLLTYLEPHQPGTLARCIFTAWNPEFLRLLNKDLKGGRALPSRQRPCRCAAFYRSADWSLRSRCVRRFTGIASHWVKNSCGGIRNRYRQDEKDPRRRSSKGGASTNEKV